jgi:hypothetical protein
MKDRLDKKKGVQMMNLLEKNVGLCEICDNYTPRVYVEDFQQECCEYCFEAYGECN